MLWFWTITKFVNYKGELMMSDYVGRVYLAGPITGLSFAGCTSWRDYARSQLHAHRIEGVSPMRHKEYLQDEAKVGDCYPEHVLSTQKAIVTRDRNDVLNCNAMIANFQDATKVSIGTCIEFGWADSFRKPIIMILPKYDESVHNHAMLRELAGAVVNTVDEAIWVATRWIR